MSMFSLAVHTSSVDEEILSRGGEGGEGVGGEGLRSCRLFISVNFSVYRIF